MREEALLLETPRTGRFDAFADGVRDARTGLGVAQRSFQRADRAGDFDKHVAGLRRAHSDHCAVYAAVFTCTLRVQQLDFELVRLATSNILCQSSVLDVIDCN